MRKSLQAWTTLLAVLVALGGTSVAQASAAPVTFDAASQFSNTQNPDGVWSYRAAGALDKQNVGDCSANDELYCWTNGLQIPDAAVVAVNNTGHTLYFPDYAPASVALPTGWIELDPESIASSEVSFTAPVKGTYVIAGTFQGIDGSVALQHSQHPVTVTQKGKTIYSGMIETPQQLDPFKLSERMTAGEVVNFQADTSPTTFSYLGTGLQVTATLSSAHCTVPTLHGLSLAAAEGKLRKEDCAPGPISRRGKAKRVSAQSPTSGTLLPAGGKVAITLS